MTVYVGNFGYQNIHWSTCLAENVLTLEVSEEGFEYWVRQDKSGWVDYATKNVKTLKKKLPTTPVASRWFNIITVFHETADDTWVHSDRKDLYWTTSRAGPVKSELIPDPFNPQRRVVLLKKSTDAWSNKARDGRRLIWQSIHPKAHDFLLTEATYQELSELRGYRSYTSALVAGESLHRWEDAAEWKGKLGSKRPVRNFSPLDMTIFDAVRRIQRTVLDADGRSVERTIKVKELECSEEEMRQHLRRLHYDNQGLCALTGLPMLTLDQDGPEDMRLSVDRIDSEGHYGPGNVQLVCRFANFWKGARNNQRFLELIREIKSVTG